MKLIQCIVRPNKVEQVIEALRQLNVSGMTISEVRGHGKQRDKIRTGERNVL